METNPENVAAWVEGQECAERYGNRSQNPYAQEGQPYAVDSNVDYWYRGFDKTMAVLRVHSQGPFKLDEEGENGVTGCRDIIDATGEKIAHTSGLHDDYQDWANARLFAASPLLLALHREAQKILADHLPPNGPSHLETLTKLYELFDGPKSREVEAYFRE